MLLLASLLHGRDSPSSMFSQSSKPSLFSSSLKSLFSSNTSLSWTFSSKFLSSSSTSDSPRKSSYPPFLLLVLRSSLPYTTGIRMSSFSKLKSATFIRYPFSRQPCKPTATSPSTVIPAWKSPSSRSPIAFCKRPMSGGHISLKVIVRERRTSFRKSSFIHALIIVTTLLITRLWFRKWYITVVLTFTPFTECKPSVSPFIFSLVSPSRP